MRPWRRALPPPLPGRVAATTAPATSWIEVDAPTLEALDAIEQATTSGAEAIVVGARCTSVGTCERVVLASTDGTTWEERGSLPDDVNLLADLVADEEVLLALGNSAGADAFIWRSTDGGASWQAGGADAFEVGADGRSSRSPAGNPYHLSVLGAARGPEGIVAGGWLNSEDLDRSAIWHSADGTAWERIRLPRAMDRARGVFDVAGGAGGYVAVTGAGLWRSEDGRRWARATTGGTSEDIITEVEVTDTGFIGLGADRP